MTPIQALQNLYQASRLAPLTADQHKILEQSAQVISEAIKKEEIKPE